RLAHCKNEKRGGGKQEKSTEAPKKPVNKSYKENVPVSSGRKNRGKVEVWED
ncbi:hypothetical protein MKW98_026376, partial [Papaver atlanticum]